MASTTEFMLLKTQATAEFVPSILVPCPRNSMLFQERTLTLVARNQTYLHRLTTIRRQFKGIDSIGQ
jgi:hypothetical protein